MSFSRSAPNTRSSTGFKVSISLNLTLAAARVNWRGNDIRGPRLEDLAERKIDASRAGQRMLPVLKGSDTVIDKACGTAPHRDVAAFEAQTAHGIGAAFTAPQEYGGQAQAKRDETRPGLLFVPNPSDGGSVPPDFTGDYGNVR